MQVNSDNLPHNIEAEQAVLGAILLNNDAMNLCAGLKDIHFFDPLHARIFEVCKNKINEGSLASPVTLKFNFEGDEGLEQLGGAKYLVRMTGASCTTNAISHLSKEVMALWARRDLIKALGVANECISSPQGGEVNEITSELEARIADNKIDGGGKPPARSFLYGVHKAMESLSRAYMGEEPSGVMTGLNAIDDVLGGLKGGRSYILAGRPSMGKTSIAMNIANRVATGSKPLGVIVASLEMSEEELSKRSISQFLREKGHRIEYARMERGNITENEFRETLSVANEVQNAPIHTITAENNELNSLLSAIRTTAKRFTAENPLGLIVIDYLQLISVKGANKFETVSAASKAVKMIARELDIPVITLSQLSRAVEQREDKRPMLSDLRQSGEIEEDADAVIFCYRDFYYAERELASITDEVEQEARKMFMHTIKNDLELIYAKVRAGRIQTRNLHCEIQFNYLADKVQQEVRASA